MNNYERLKAAIEEAAAKEGFEVHNFEWFVSHLDANCVRFFIRQVGFDAMRFRKKPVVVEAWKNTDDTRSAPLWLINAWRTSKVRFVGGGVIEIHTLEGVMLAELGDWIIRGVKGELYPCKPDIFEATYEVAE